MLSQILLSHFFRKHLLTFQQADNITDCVPHSYVILQGVLCYLISDFWKNSEFQAE